MMRVPIPLIHPSPITDSLRMKKTLFLALAFPLWLSAQSDPVVDSLQKIIAQKQAALDPAGEASALFELGKLYYNRQQDQPARESTEKALAILPPGNPVLKGRLLYRKAMLIYFSGQNFPQVLSLFDSAGVLLKPSGDPVILGPFLQSYGSILNQQLKHQEGQKILLEAEQMFLKNKGPATTDPLLNVYSNLLAGSYALGDYQAALTFARKGIETGKNSSNYELIADLYYNNALTLSALKYGKDSEQSYLKSLDYARKGNATSSIISACIALGDYYFHLSQPRPGFQYLAEAQTAATGTQDFYSLATIRKIEAVWYTSQKDYVKAMTAIDSCIAYFEKTQGPRQQQGIFYQKADILQHMGRLEEAAEWAKKELDLARRTNSRLQEFSSYLLLSEIEKKRNNFPQALAYYEQYAAVKDSVYDNNLENRLAEERTRQNVEAEQDARRKAELETQLLASRNQLYGIVAAGLFFILLAGGYLYRQLQSTRKQLEIQNGRLQQLNLTKDKFFGIIAHDLRNPLSAFQGVGEQLNFYLQKGDTDKLQKISGLISKSAANLSALLDNLLSWALLNRGMIPYHPEVLSPASEATLNFEIHENAARAKDIRLENHIPEHLRVSADRNALQTILRNLIGNAVKFTPPGGSVTVGGGEKDGQVVISVSDTGAGISAEKMDQLFSLEKRSEHGTAGEKGAGLGLVLCRELAELNKGSLRIFSAEGTGARFEISLPGEGGMNQD